MGCWEEWKPIFAMLTVNVAFAAMNTMIKKVIDEGMNQLVLITYRQLVATLFMAPVAYFTERMTRPKLTAEIFVYLFFSAMLGLERVKLNSKAGIAKVLGTVICVTGAMLLTLYKGIALANTSNRLSEMDHTMKLMEACNRGKWMLGTVALFAGTFSWSSWFLLQSKVGKKYPSLYSGTALIFFLSFLQAATLTFATQRGSSIWFLKDKVQMITVMFSGLVGSGLGFLAMSWCVSKRGPVFTAAFSPLIQILVAAIEVSILHEQLRLGSVLGSVFVVAGLYFLLWGKSKDARSSSCAMKPSEEINEEIHGPVPAV